MMRKWSCCRPWKRLQGSCMNGRNFKISIDVEVLRSMLIIQANAKYVLSFVDSILSFPVVVIWFISFKFNITSDDLLMSTRRLSFTMLIVKIKNKKCGDKRYSEGYSLQLWKSACLERGNAEMNLLPRRLLVRIVHGIIPANGSLSRGAGVQRGSQQFLSY